MSGSTFSIARGKESDLGAIALQQPVTPTEFANLLRQAQAILVKYTFQDLCDARAALADAKAAGCKARASRDAAAERNAHAAIEAANNSLNKMKRTPWYVASRFSAPQRNGQTIVECTAIVGDADQPGATRDGLRTRLDALEVSYIMATSTSHGCDQQARYRVIIPLATPLEPHRYVAVWEFVNDKLGGILDPGAKDATRLNYFPRVPTGATGHEVIVVDDRPWFDASGIGESETAPPAVPSTGITPLPPRGYTLEQLREILKSVPVPSSENDWWPLLRAIHHETGGSQEGLMLADDWSRKGPNYGGIEPIRSKWESSAWSDGSRPSYTAAKLLSNSIANIDRFGVVTTPPGTPSPKKAATASDVDTAVQLICGSTIQVKSVDWLWKGQIAAGKFHILAGAPGTAKTTAAISFAATISTGGKWPDGTRAEIGNALIWSGEDSFDDTLMPRYLAAGGDPSKLFFVSSVAIGSGERRPFDPSRDMPALLKVAQEIGGIKLIIVDPIVSAVAGDSHKNAETRRGLQPLVDVAESLGAALLGISHYTKGTQGNNPIERVTGSIAFGAVARVIFGVAKMQDSDDRIFVRAKSNVGPDGGGFKYQVAQHPVPGHPEIADGASTIVWGEVIEGSAHSLLKDAESDADPTKKEQAIALIPQILEQHGSEMPASELHAALEMAGIGRDTRYAALQRLGLKRERIGQRGEYAYRPAISTQFPIISNLETQTTKAVETSPRIAACVSAHPAAHNTNSELLY